MFSEMEDVSLPLCDDLHHGCVLRDNASALESAQSASGTEAGAESVVAHVALELH